MRNWNTPEAAAASRSGRRQLSDAAKKVRGKILTQRAEKTEPGQLFPAVSRNKVWAVWSEASYFLGLSDKAVLYLNYLISATDQADWSGQWLPIVGKSNRDLGEILNLGVTQLKAVARELIEAGLILPHGEGRRFVRRDFRDGGRITHAVGFDLSPLAIRLDELKSISTGRLSQERTLKRLRRDARYEADECLSLTDDAQTVRQIRDLVLEAKDGRTVDGVQAALSRLQAIRLDLEDQLACEYAEDSDPIRSVSRPSIIPTTPISLEKTVTIKQRPDRATHIAASNDAPNRAGEKKEDSDMPLSAPPVALEDAIKTARLHPRELVRLVPSLAACIVPAHTNQRLAWSDICDAAERLSIHLGVSRDAWGQACRIMGRKAAAVSVALIASRPDQHYSMTKGGYFRGMLRAAEDGDLNLMPSIYGMRERCAAIM
ncbi:plasmid replication protein RepC [Komagataeibacter europaeus]|uniref:plasmid replication protein RepC n=1 Tax=Komagataeibacter europaeus TaxID=33995 RepID=UPI00037523A7|nr:plasmid replication protein RepC [Komagataeibacter europaeus]GBQ46962.1 replication protein C [Komagataeibacter europaeus LMG 18890]